MRFWVHVLTALALTISAAHAQIAIERSQPPAERPAQEPRLNLIADRISYDQATGRLVLTGNVVVLTDGRVIQAQKITYDDRSGQLEAEGGLTIQEDSGGEITGDVATLDADLRNGIILGFRTLIQDDLVVAAVGAQRVDDRYFALSRAVASTCDVCTEDDIPAWQLRAQRIVYDDEAQVVHYENAIFDLFSVPVLYFPYFRHPSPNVDRATGVLAPEFTRSSRYGSAVKIPYFIALTPSSDLTLTPFITQEERSLLEAEYRELFDASSLSLYTSVLPTPTTDEFDERWHFIGFGDHFIDSETTARARFEFVSDDQFLDEFSYSRPDRLPSFISVDQFRTDGFWDVSTTTYVTLRDSELQSSVPIVLPSAEYLSITDRNGLFGGTTTLNASAAQLYRTEGRDSARISLGGGWERSDRLRYGVASRSYVDLQGDAFQTRDDPLFPEETIYRFRPLAGVELSLPFVRHGERGTDIIEPIVQFVTAGETTKVDEIPNEDSQQVDFDETNLFAKSRFPGEDRFESGNRADVGLRYQRSTPGGWSASGTVGRVFREEVSQDFAEGTGLDGRRSSTVAAFSLGFRNQLALDARTLIDAAGDIPRAEVIGNYNSGRFQLNGSYVFLVDETSDGEPIDRTEANLAAAVPINESWTGESSVRRDLENGNYIENRLAAIWRSDCASIELSATRDYTRSESVEPSTEYSLTVRFNGIGDTAGAPRRICSQP